VLRRRNNRSAEKLVLRLVVRNSIRSLLWQAFSNTVQIGSAQQGLSGIEIWSRRKLFDQIETIRSSNELRGLLEGTN
jgi:hypothetical protein